MKMEPTPEETALKNALKVKGIDVVEQYDDKFKTVDLRVKDARLDIEVDGQQHLTDPNQIVSDLNRGYWSQKNHGYGTIHIPNYSLHKNLPKIAWALSLAIKLRIEKIRSKISKRKA